MKTYASVYIGAATLSVFITPIVVKIATRFAWVDKPGVRKVHKSPVPRIGGAAVVIAFLAMLSAALMLDNVIGNALREIRTQVIALLAASLFVAVVGLIDDLKNLRARIKLLAQIIAAIFICKMGVRINSINIPFYGLVDLGLFGCLFTIVWVVGITNAVNLIDGLDGLASGISAIACGSIAFFAIITGQPIMAVLMLALLGSLTGFLIFNINPAKIFLGDSGSMFLGFFLASSSILCTMKTAALIGIILPALALGIPIFDTLFSILRRKLNRRGIFSADREHIHHRLLDKGLTQRQATILIYLITLSMTGLGIFMMFTHQFTKFWFFLGALISLVMVFRIAGVVNFHHSLVSFLHNLSLSRQASHDKHEFEQAGLHLAETKTFFEWWECLSSAAQAMEISRLSLWSLQSDGWRCQQQWPEQINRLAGQKTITITIPLDESASSVHMKIEAELFVKSSREAALKRLTFFGRLIDEKAVSALPAYSKVA